jgi:hypothetical protein
MVLVPFTSSEVTLRTVIVPERPMRRAGALREADTPLDDVDERRACLMDRKVPAHITLSATEREFAPSFLAVILVATGTNERPRLASELSQMFGMPSLPRTNLVRIRSSLSLAEGFILQITLSSRRAFNPKIVVEHKEQRTIPAPQARL